VEPSTDDDLKLRIPRDVWDAASKRTELDLMLDDGIVRDADGDVVMDTAGSIDYSTNGMPTAQYIQMCGALYTRLVCQSTRLKHTYRLTIKQCIQRNGEDQTLAELRREVQQMLTKRVWRPVLWDYLTDEERRSTISSSMFLKEKFAADGNFDKLKARLVAGGHQQDRSVYSDSETSSPTVSTTSLFLIAAIAAKENRRVVTIDFSGAYLNAHIKKKVLMKIDKILSSVVIDLDPSYSEYVRKDGTLVLQLKKALYGCVESGKLWYDLLSSKLGQLGFTANDYECCVFNKDVDGHQVTICVYVDDLFVACSDANILDATILEIDAMFKGCTLHRGSVHSYLGMIFDFNTEGEVHISMDGYVEDFLVEYAVSGAAPTPAKTDLFEIDPQAEILDDAGRDDFHSRVAKILFVAKRTRPDLLTAVSFLSTRVQSPTTQDLDKLHRLLKYINGTRDLWLTLRPDHLWEVLAFIDASYGVHVDGKGHTGVTMLLGQGAFYVASTKQKLVAKSSCEAEIIGVSDGLSEVIWVRNFLLGQGLDIGPAIVFQDNQSTMKLFEKGRSTSSRTRHIHIRYFFIKDRVESGEVCLRYMPTEDMIADILTKPLQGELFRRLRAKLLNLSPSA